MTILLIRSDKNDHVPVTNFDTSKAVIKNYNKFELQYREKKDIYSYYLQIFQQTKSQHILLSVPFSPLEIWCVFHCKILHPLILIPQHEMAVPVVFLLLPSKILDHCRSHQFWGQYNLLFWLHKCHIAIVFLQDCLQGCWLQCQKFACQKSDNFVWTWWWNFSWVWFQ